MPNKIRHFKENIIDERFNVGHGANTAKNMKLAVYDE
jgi:hypothetical protein